MKRKTSPTSRTANSKSASQDNQAFREDFHRKILLQLREMLKILKQGEQPEHRKQLQSYCQHLSNLGKQAKLPEWVALLETAKAAIANPENPYQASARLIIKEIKQAGKLVLEGRTDKIHPSEKLQALAPRHFSALVDIETNWLETNWQEEEVLDHDLWQEEETSSHDQKQVNQTDNLLNEEVGELQDHFTDSAEATSNSPTDELATLFSEDSPEEPAEATPSAPLPSDSEISDLFSEPFPFGEDSAEGDLAALLGLESTGEGKLDLDGFEEPEDISGLEQLLDSSPTEEDISSQGSVADLAVFAQESAALPDLYEQFDELDAVIEESAVVVAQERGSSISFEKLEALLNFSAAEIDATRTILEQQKSAFATAETPLTPSSQSEDNLDDEFKDLEKLLEQADPTRGSSPGLQPARPRTGKPKAKKFEQTMRVPVKQLDNFSNLIGELVVKRNSLEQDQERLRQFLDNLLNQVQKLGDVGARMQDLYERSLLEGALLASQNSSQFSSGSDRPSESGSDDREDQGLNALEMDRFTGFHLLSQEMIELIVRVRESSSDIQFLVDETDKVARTLRQVTTQLQENITKSRMVPFSQTADRLPRAVREVSLKLNKKVELHAEGREVLIDKMILEHLYNPMTHLVNNAITHGIESPEVRLSQGKSSVGRIAIRAFLQGNQTVIAVSDDGAGIDPERVKAKAIEKGLINRAEAQALSNQEVYDFLFHAGFSTKDQADDFAGRGVGMDVVHTSLSEIRGTIGIDSTLGKGTTFTIRLPLTLSICKALCCLSNHNRIAFPMDGVEDMQDYLPSDIQTNAEGLQCVRWRDTLLPFKPLDNLLSYNRQISRGTVYGGKQEDDTVSIVVLRSAGNLLAIQVDQVLGEEEIVIKQLTGPVPKPPGIAGATVRGDGSVMPIGDVLELIEISQGRMRAYSGGDLWQKAPGAAQPGLGAQDLAPLPIKTEPMVLIVDDSITVRELLSLSFSKAGYRVEQARDGQEAWEKLRSGLPCDMVFCDIEMPRMNGLELLSHIQKDQRLASLPLALLTSRGAERHRKVAAELGATAYLTKPYTERDLLDVAERMLEGEVLLANSTRASAEVKPEIGSHSRASGTPAVVEPKVAVKSEPTVLIVDDSVVVREMLSTTFKNAGYRVEQARDGQEAWEKLRAGLACNVVFCDIEMPRMNGLELLSRLQEDEQFSSVPVAMITSRGAQKMQKMAAKRGAKGYFVKPYVEGALLTAADRLIAGEILLENINLENINLENIQSD